MDANIIIIGDEILLGHVTDTNSGAIARALEPLGIKITAIETVGDEAEAITESINRCLSRVGLVITTGGLGPTKDDITKPVLTKIFGGTLRRDAAVTENIHRIFAGRNLKLNPLTEDQALVPTSCRVIQNVFGTAPIMWFEREGRVLITMPGVPTETEGMLKHGVTDAIKKHFCADTSFTHRTAIITGISESALAQRLEQFEMNLPENFHLAYLPDSPVIKLRLDGRAPNTECVGLEADASEIFKNMCALLGELVVCDHDASPAEILIERLRSNSLTVSTAESCTGGNIAHSITAVAGCSDVFAGSVVSYVNEVKTNILGVDATDIATHGAVSRRVVESMARGVRIATGTDTSIATSGIAGPGGGSDDKPVGTVWIAVSTPLGTVSECYRFPGDRNRVIARATTTALLKLAAELQK